MRKREELTKITELLKKPSFSSKEASALGVSASSLAYYVKTGDLRRLAHGLYASPNFEISTDWQWEDLLQVVTSVPEGVICLITALRLWDLTDEHSREFWIAIPHRCKAQHKPHSRFVRYRNMNLGRTTFNIGGYEVAIFDETRTMLDAFRILSPEIAIKALKRLAAQGKLDFPKVSRYSKELRVNITPHILMVST